MDDVKADINALNQKVNEVSERLVAVETYTPLLKELMERTIESNEGLDKTLGEMQITMVKMNEKMDTQAKEAETMRLNLQSAIDDTNQKVEKIDQKIESVESKGKFDILKYIKENFIKIVLGVAASAYIISDIISKYIKG